MTSKQVVNRLVVFAGRFMQRVVMSVYLEHGLLILAVLHLRSGQVQDTSLHRVLVTVVDEDVRAAYYHKVLHPGVRARLHEAQVSLLRHHRATNRRK